MILWELHINTNGATYAHLMPQLWIANSLSAVEFVEPKSPSLYVSSLGSKLRSAKLGIPLTPFHGHSHVKSFD